MLELDVPGGLDYLQTQKQQILAEKSRAPGSDGKATCHVITTTITLIAGFVPLLIGRGLFWRPLAVAIAGGITGSSIAALFLSQQFTALSTAVITQRDSARTLSGCISTTCRACGRSDS